jgi:hypothetical protein
MRIETRLAKKILPAHFNAHCNAHMARPSTGLNGSPTNLYLRSDLKTEARKAAKLRYKISLSELVEKLLAKELSLKRGMLAKSPKSRKAA